MIQGRSAWFFLVAGILFVISLFAYLSYEGEVESDDDTWISGWNNTEGRFVSSVTWSPDGKHIAFLAISHEIDKDYYPISTEIWLLQPSLRDDKTKLKRLFQWSGKASPSPSDLFWVNNEKLAWRGYANDYSWFSFYVSDINKRSIRHFIRNSFSLFSTNGGEGQGGITIGTDDVYWCKESQTLLFSGVADGPDNAITSLVYSYDTRTQKLRAIPFDGVYVSLSGSNVKDSVCFSMWDGEASQVWRGNIMQEFPTAEVVNGARRKNKLILYLRSDTRDENISWLELPYKIPDFSWRIGSIVVFNPKSGLRNVVANIDTSSWEKMMRPGSPYCWSPDGKRIAYVEGSKIKIVGVDTGIGPNQIKDAQEK